MRDELIPLRCAVGPRKFGAQASQNFEPYLGAVLIDVPMVLLLFAWHGRVTAIKERKKALAGSVVKIAGRDVMLSKKIMISIVMVPLLWLFYAVLMVALTDWGLSTKVNNSQHYSTGRKRAGTCQPRLSLDLFGGRRRAWSIACRERH